MNPVICFPNCCKTILSSVDRRSHESHVLYSQQSVAYTVYVVFGHDALRSGLHCPLDIPHQ